MRKRLIYLAAGFAVALGLASVFVLSRAITPVILNASEGSVVHDDTHTLLFAGDIMLGRMVKKQIQKEQDPLYPFLLIADTTRAADLAIANLEGPISDRGGNQGSIYSFRFDPVGAIKALQFAGFDVVSLANNHIWDWGKLAAADTMTHLADGGIGYAGFGKNYDEANAPVIKLVGDPANDGALTRVAFLSFTNLYPKALEADTTLGISDFSAMNQVVSSLKSSGRADIIVVLFHGGVEYQTHSNAAQRQIAHGLIDAGADLFIGTHPHTAQETEHYKEGYIAYSLGNFVFDQDFSKATMQGLMVEATIKDKKIVDFKEIPIKLSPTFQPYLSEQTGL